MTEFALKVQLFARQKPHGMSVKDWKAASTMPAKLDAVKLALLSVPGATCLKDDATLGIVYVEAPDTLRSQLEALPGVVSVLDTSLPVKLPEPINVVYPHA